MFDSEVAIFDLGHLCKYPIELMILLEDAHLHLGYSTDSVESLRPFLTSAHQPHK